MEKEAVKNIAEFDIDDEDMLKAIWYLQWYESIYIDPKEVKAISVENLILQAVDHLRQSKTTTPDGVSFDSPYASAGFDSLSIYARMLLNFIDAQRSDYQKSVEDLTGYLYERATVDGQPQDYETVVEWLIWKQYLRDNKIEATSSAQRMAANQQVFQKEQT